MCSYETGDNWKLWSFFAIFFLHIVFEFFGMLQVPIGFRCSSNSNFSISSIASQCHLGTYLSLLSKGSLSLAIVLSLSYLLQDVPGVRMFFPLYWRSFFFLTIALSLFLPSVEALSFPSVEMLFFPP